MTRQPLLTLIAAGMALALVGPPARAQNELPARLSPEMQKLGLLVGKRSMTGKLQPPHGAPSTASGAGEAAWALGDRYLLIRETITPESGAPTKTLLLLGYDPHAK